MSKEGIKLPEKKLSSRSKVLPSFLVALLTTTATFSDAMARDTNVPSPNESLGKDQLVRLLTALTISCAGINFLKTDGGLSPESDRLYDLFFSSGCTIQQPGVFAEQGCKTGDSLAIGGVQRYRLTEGGWRIPDLGEGFAIQRAICLPPKISRN